MTIRSAHARDRYLRLIDRGPLRRDLLPDRETAVEAVMSSAELHKVTNRLVPLAGGVVATVLGLCAARAQQPPTRHTAVHRPADISGAEARTENANVMVSTSD